jgi:homoserine O-succinyltransferase
VLTKSKESGVDLFVKKKKKSLFVHFQGHPEYGELTLLKEYRRDVRRFLQQERPTYPNMPQGYFDAAAKKLLEDFKTAVLSRLHESLTAEFPDREVAEGLQNSWLSSSVAIYHNWLQYIASKKPEIPKVSAVAAVGPITERKRSAVR